MYTSACTVPVNLIQYARVTSLRGPDWESFLAQDWRHTAPHAVAVPVAGRGVGTTTGMLRQRMAHYAPSRRDKGTYQRKRHVIVCQPVGVVQVDALWGDGGVHQQQHHGQVGPGEGWGVRRIVVGAERVAL